MVHTDQQDIFDSLWNNKDRKNYYAEDRSMAEEWFRLGLAQHPASLQPIFGVCEVCLGTENECACVRSSSPTLFQERR